MDKFEKIAGQNLQYSGYGISEVGTRFYPRRTMAICAFKNGLCAIFEPLSRYRALRVIADLSGQPVTLLCIVPMRFRDSVLFTVHAISVEARLGRKQRESSPLEYINTR